MKWPKVVENDDGIRPAGKPDECFYCKRKVGHEHKRDCVIVTRRVKVRYSFTIELELPYSWDARAFESHRNEGSWCATNALAEIAAYSREKGTNQVKIFENGVELEQEDDGGPKCLCSQFDAEWIEPVDNTPKRQVCDPSEDQIGHYVLCKACGGIGCVKGDEK